MIADHSAITTLCLLVIVPKLLKMLNVRIFSGRVGQMVGAIYQAITAIQHQDRIKSSRKLSLQVCTVFCFNFDFSVSHSLLLNVNAFYNAPDRKRTEISKSSRATSGMITKQRNNVKITK